MKRVSFFIGKIVLCVVRLWYSFYKSSLSKEGKMFWICAVLLFVFFLIGDQFLPESGVSRVAKVAIDVEVKKGGSK